MIELTTEQVLDRINNAIKDVMTTPPDPERKFTRFVQMYLEGFDKQEVGGRRYTSEYGVEIIDTIKLIDPEHGKIDIDRVWQFKEPVKWVEVNTRIDTDPVVQSNKDSGTGDFDAN